MSDKNGKYFANNHTVLVCMFVICAVSCVILLCFGGFKTFLFDDISQIDIVYRDTLLEVIQNCKRLDCNPPLSHILSHFWLKCVPYGTVYLKIFNIIMVSIGTFICGCAAYRLNGSIAGIAVFLPWLFYIIKGSIQKQATFWPASPSFADVVELYIQLASGHIWLLCWVCF